MRMYHFLCIVFVIPVLSLAAITPALATEEVELDPSATIEAVSFIDEDTGWVVSNNNDGKGSILATQDSGTTWVSQYTSSKKLHGIHCPTSKLCFAVGDSGTILRSDNGGTSWTSLDQKAKSHLFGVSVVDSKRGIVLAVGEKGTLLRTTNNGKKWSAIASQTKNKLNALTFVSKTKGWAVGEKGTILTTTTGGAKWIVVIEGTQNFLDIHSFNDTTSTTLFIAGEQGLILQSTDSGASWTQQQSKTTQTLRGIYVNDKKGFVVGEGGTILATDDNGTTWGDASDDENTTTLHDVQCFGQKLCVTSNNDVVFFQFDFEKAIQSSTATDEGDEDAEEEIEIEENKADQQQQQEQKKQNLPDLIITDVKLKKGELTY
ncbi:MAG: YCF48-related protein, partial [Patescibacteria group bacterium]